MRKYRVLVIPHDIGGCGCYRLIMPLRTFRSEVIEMVLHQGGTIDLSAYDAFLLQRTTSPEELALIRHVKALGKKVIIDIDDKFPITEHSHVEQPLFNLQSAWWQVMHECILLADGIIAAGDLGAAHYRHFNGRVVSAPNAFSLDWPCYHEGPLRRLYDRIVMFWSGSHTHQTALSIIAPAVEQAVAENPELVLAISGPPWYAEIFRIPAERKYYADPSRGIAPYRPGYPRWAVTDPGAFLQFLRTASVADFSLSPLEFHEFNDYKSEIRILESAAWAVPTIATPVVPYRRFYEVSRGACVLVENNDPAGWYDAITRFTRDAAYRRDMGRRARQAVVEHYDVADANRIREAFLLNILEDRPHNVALRSCRAEIRQSDVKPRTAEHVPLIGETERPFWSVLVLVPPGAAPPEAVGEAECIPIAADPETVFAELNRRLTTARGEWIHIIRAGDRLSPNFHALLRAAVEHWPDVGAALCRVLPPRTDPNANHPVLADQATGGILKDALEKLATRGPLPLSAFVLRRSALEQLGGFCLDAGMAADWELQQRVAMFFSIYYDPRLVVQLGSISDTSRRPDLVPTVPDLFRAVAVARKYLPADLVPRARDWAGLRGLEAARQSLAEGNWIRSRNEVRAVLQAQPSPVVLRSLEEGISRHFEPYLAEINHLVEQYRSDRNATAACERLLLARRQVAEQWAQVPPAELEFDYQGGPGKLHAAIRGSGLVNEPLAESDLAEANRLAKVVAERGAMSCDMAPLLAAALYWPAHRLALPLDLPRVPSWLRSEVVRYVFGPPTLPQSDDEVSSAADHLRRWLKYLHERLFGDRAEKLWHDAAFVFAQSAYITALARDRGAVRVSAIQRAEIIEFALKHLGHRVDHIFPPRASQRTKARVGILAPHFGPSPETFAALPFFEHLDRDRFEIGLYALSRLGHPLEAYCASRADVMLQLPADLAQQVQAIRKDDLDVLVIVGNVTELPNPLTWLALHRLGRVQLAGAGTPCSTGLRNVDAYLSGRLMEGNSDPRGEYSEELLLLDGAGLCWSFGTEANPAASGAAVSRASLGLARDTVVYVAAVEP
ncbi:MAG: hypothetical protein NZ700_06435, partial [Gemmataceae bacterium]|nr:hypothetical protein [Gemmataceae bacterium]MDW8266161.1 hypothetical protein [Gemmataceae bacterium]